MVIMNDLEWPILSYYVIYYETLRKVVQRTENEALKLCVLVHCAWLTYICYFVYKQKHM